MNAAFRVDFAGPFVSVQDRGRPGFLRFGVTESGPMDRVAFGILRHALGGARDFRALEVSVGGLVLTCMSGSVTAGVIGGEFDIRIDGVRQSAWSVFSLNEGQTLTIRPGPAGSWCYLGFTGGIVSPRWLGSHAMHLTSGLCGRALESGDVLEIANAETRRDLHAAFPVPGFAGFAGFGGRVRIVTGPQDHHFSAETLVALTEGSFRLTQEYDRMGMRLKGPPLVPQNALSIPSEALVRGSVQVPGNGDPLILMADHQTVGGYPKIATVISADVDRVAQARPGDRIGFAAIPVAEAVAAARKAHAALCACIDDQPNWRGSPGDRLYRVNLISGVVSQTPD